MSMSNLPAVCLTCLSNLEEGATLTETLINFLCNVLHFKAELLQDSADIICRKCYKTLIELKCFYNQLRDVEVYFENKTKLKTNSNEIQEDEAEIPYVGEFECNVTITDDSKSNVILLNDDDECRVVEDSKVLSPNKTSDTPSGRRFVCLTCSKLFGSYNDLHLHEKTHSLQLFQTASPVFLPAISKVPQHFICSECGQEFSNKFSHEEHMKKHKKVKPFCCKSCKHRFAKKELLVIHESKYKCVVCHIKCCSRPALDAHMKDKHSGNTNGYFGNIES